MQKPRHWTPQDDARLIALQADDYSIEGMVDVLSADTELPYTRHQISKRCRELGVTPRTRRYGPGARFTRPEIEAMQRAYQAGTSARAIAAANQCSYEVIRQMVAVRILTRDPASARQDLDSVRAGQRVAVPAPIRIPVPDAPSSDLWRLWERAESSLRQSVRGAAA